MNLRILICCLVAGIGLCSVAIGQDSGSLDLDIDEIKSIQGIRRATNDDAQRIDLSLSYLEAYADGRYRDEVYLLLAEAYGSLGENDKALQSYTTLVDDYQQSLFRDLALANGIDILRTLGATEQAQEWGKTLQSEYPKSVYLGRDFFVQALEHYNAQRYAEALDLLEGVNPNALAVNQRRDYFKISGWSSYHTNRKQEALANFSRYADFDDDPTEQAPIYMLLARSLETAATTDFWLQALDYYEQIIRDAADASYVTRALYYRAALYERLQTEAPNPAENWAEQAIQYYLDYLDSNDRYFLIESWQSLASIYHEQGQYEQAYEYYQNFINDLIYPLTYPQSARGFSEVLQNTARYAKGLEFSEKMLGYASAVSASVESYWKLTKAQFQQLNQDCPSAMQTLDGTLQYLNTDQQTLYYRVYGLCSYEQQNYSAAALALLKVAFLPNNWPDVGLSLIDSWRKTDYEPSITHQLVANYADWPEDAQLINESLYALWISKNDSDSAQFLNSLSAEQKSENLFALNLSAQLLLNAGEYETALEEGQQTINLCRSHEIGIDDNLALIVCRSAFQRQLEIYAQLQRFTDAIAWLSENYDSEQQDLWGSVGAFIYLNWASADANPENVLEQGLASNIDADAKILLLLNITQLYIDQQRFEDAQALINSQTELIEQQQINELQGLLALYWARNQAAQGQEFATNYEQALSKLPAKYWDLRLEAALGSLKAATPNYKLIEENLVRLEQNSPDDQERLKAKQALLTLYMAWSKSVQDDQNLAVELNRKAASVSAPQDWQVKYQLLAERSKILLQQGDYEALATDYEGLIPQISNTEIQQQLNYQLGQIYYVWAQKSKNNKDIQQRASKALELLSPKDENRIQNSALLQEKSLDAQKKPVEATRMLVEVFPSLSSTKAKQNMALRIANRYRKTHRNLTKAAEWFKAADAKDNSNTSTEAVYNYADVLYSLNKKTEAANALLDLEKRNISKTKLLVPILYHLALYYHEKEDLKQALNYYKKVASTKSDLQLKIYPTTIKLAQEQAQEIENYLRFQGPVDIAVPKIDQ